jgi:hypothetical protein
MLLMVRLNKNKKTCTHEDLLLIENQIFLLFDLMGTEKKVACTRIIEIDDETEEGTEEDVMISVALRYIL